MVAPLVVRAQSSSRDELVAWRLLLIVVVAPIMADDGFTRFWLFASKAWVSIGRLPHRVCLCSWV